MLKFRYLLLSTLFAFIFIACDKDPEEGDGFPAYTVAIISPSSDNLNGGESFHIHVDFDEASDLTIHHINIQITTEAGEVIYDMPTVAHVHEESGHHEHHDDFTPAVPAGTQLTLTAKVWGHTEGISETTSTKSFMIN